MSESSFDQVIDRTIIPCEKYGLRERLFNKDVLPMWVADMDFASPPFVLEALRERLSHPILGYDLTPDATYNAIADWYADQYQAPIQSDWIRFSHNVVNGIHLAIEAATERGDRVLVQTPVYPPFMGAPQKMGREAVISPLVMKAGHLEIDFDDIEKQLTSKSISAFLLCNPQNPTGRVWRKAELVKLGELCAAHNVVVISDEIHADLLLADVAFTSMREVEQEIGCETIILNSPGKSFNLAGLQIGYAVIASENLRKKWDKAADYGHVHHLDSLGTVAIEAAYSAQGKAWLESLLGYLHGNMDQLEARLAEELPWIKMMRPEATYLVWLDFSERFSNQEVLKQWLVEEAKLGLNDGLSFCGEGDQSWEGWMRMNLGLPRERLNQGISQLIQAG